MTLTISEIRDRRDAMRDPILRADADTLVSIVLDGPSYAGFSRALEVRKELNSDTQAPSWLRQVAEEIVEEVRPGTSVTPRAFA